MKTLNFLIDVFWAILILYWAISAIGVKKNIRTSEWRRNAGIRIILVVIVNTFGILEIIYLFAVAKLKFSRLFGSISGK